MDLQDILRKLGWDDGFQIPIANAENKALEEQVAKLTLRKNKSKNELERAKSRLEGLGEHFKYVQQENEQNQKFMTAQKQKLDSTEHYYQLTKAEKASVQADVKKMMRDMDELMQQQNMKKNDLQRCMTKAQTLQIETAWDEEALRAWDETLNKREEDVELIKLFSKEDARKFHQLETKRQALQVDCDNRKKVLDKLVVEMRNNEMVIDRTGKVLKEQETERNALVRQWKEGVNMLQQRDEDVVKMQELLIITQELIEKQKEKLDEENTFLENEKRNNREMVLEMENLNVINSRMRKDITEMIQESLTMKSELQALKREAASSSQTLENERIKKREMDNSIIEKETRCVRFARDIEMLNIRLDNMRDSTLSSAQKIKNLEKMLEMEEKLYNIYVSDTEKINTQLYRNDLAYKEQLSIGKSLEMETANTVLFCTQLKKRIKYETGELEKFKEVVYNMEYRINEFEKRLLILELESVTDDFLEEKLKKIDELEETLANHRAVQHTLQTQVDKLREEMDRLKLAIALDKEQLTFLSNKCEQNMFENEISKKHISAAKRATQEKQVEENMMRLRINQIEKDMKKEEKMIFNMARLRLNLDQVVRERQLEINTNKSIMQAKRRNLDDDRRRLRADIVLRRIKIDQLQKKYHIALSSLGKDEEGQPMSVSNFRIRNAQEKLFLQQQGDLLDQKIKTAEKEIVAMENTLKLVNLTNVAFKKSLSPVTEEDKEVEEMKMLEIEMNKFSDILKESKKTFSKANKELQGIKSELEEKESDRDNTKDTVTRLEEEFEQLQKQEMDKAEKLRRAECQIKRLLKKLENSDISQYNRDFEIKLLKDGNRNVMQRLQQLCEMYLEVAPLIYRYLTEQELQLPEKKLWSSSSSSLHVSLASCSSKRQIVKTQSKTQSVAGNEINVKKVELPLYI